MDRTSAISDALASVSIVPTKEAKCLAYNFFLILYRPLVIMQACAATACGGRQRIFPPCPGRGPGNPTCHATASARILRGAGRGNRNTAKMARLRRPLQLSLASHPSAARVGRRPVQGPPSLLSMRGR